VLGKRIGAAKRTRHGRSRHGPSNHDTSIPRSILYNLSIILVARIHSISVGCWSVFVDCSYCFIRDIVCEPNEGGGEGNHAETRASRDGTASTLLFVFFIPKRHRLLVESSHARTGLLLGSPGAEHEVVIRFETFHLMISPSQYGNVTVSEMSVNVVFYFTVR